MAYDPKKAKDYFQRKKAAGQELVQVTCSRCGGPTTIKKYRLSIYKQRGKSCQACCSQISGERLKNLRANQTPEERSEHARQARSVMTPETRSEAVRKQWETIRNDPVKLEQISQARSNRSKAMWENRPNETRERILTALTGSNGCGRSKLSDEFRDAMVRAGLYEGFASEEYFHGFFPDEINHKLRLIVEVYGDVYHCNPKDFKDPDQYVSFIGRTVGEQWNRDRRRLGCFYKHGYVVIVVWEQDIRNNLQGQLQRIQDAINKATRATR